MRWYTVVVFLAACAPAVGPATATGAPSGSPSSNPTGAATAIPTGTATATPTATGTGTGTPTATPAASAPAGPVPTGGSVLLGDIVAPKSFNPKPTLVSLESNFVTCFNQARAKNPDLHGKLSLRLVLNESGSVLTTTSDGTGSANDAGLVSCLGEVLKGAKFPKPGGTATVSVPMVFRQD
jgi:hypothetical protein